MKLPFFSRDRYSVGQSLTTLVFLIIQVLEPDPVTADTGLLVPVSFGAPFSSLTSDGEEAVQCGPVSLSEDGLHRIYVCSDQLVEGQYMVSDKIVSISPAARPQFFVLDPSPVSDETSSGETSPSATDEQGAEVLKAQANNSNQKEMNADIDENMSRLTLTAPSWLLPIGVGAIGSRVMNVEEIDSGLLIEVELLDGMVPPLTLTPENFPLCFDSLPPNNVADDLAAVYAFEPNCNGLSINLNGLDVKEPSGCKLVMDRLLCGLSKSQVEIQVETEHWGSIALPVPADASFQLSQVSLELPSTASPVLNVEAPENTEVDLCPDPKSVVTVTAYCAGGTCANDAPFALSTQPASLDQMGWTDARPPDSVRLRLAGNDAAEDIPAPFGSDLSDAVAALRERAPRSKYLLRLPAGRSPAAVRVFKDQNCTGDSEHFDLLRNPVPEVSHCGSITAFGANEEPSRCLELSVVDSEDQGSELSPVSLIEFCSPKPILMHVVQNEEMNGPIGSAINETLEALIARQSSTEQCLNVDYSTSRDENRRSLGSGQEIFVNGESTVVEALQSVDYINQSSDILRDLRWIWRERAKQLSAIVVIAQGDDVFIDDMTASPEALAWEILDVPVHLIDTSGKVRCGMFIDELRFDSCETVTSETLDETVSQLVLNQIAEVENK